MTENDSQLIKMVSFTTLLLGGLLLGTGSAYACTFDSDCGVAARCQKNGGLYGVCMNNSNSTGGSLGRLITDDAAKDAGLTACTFNTDCQSGYSCSKYGLEGFCLKNN